MFKESKNQFQRNRKTGSWESKIWVLDSSLYWLLEGLCKKLLLIFKWKQTNDHNLVIVTQNGAQSFPRSTERIYLRFLKARACVCHFWNWLRSLFRLNPYRQIGLFYRNLGPMHSISSSQVSHKFWTVFWVHVCKYLLSTLLVKSPMSALVYFCIHCHCQI